MNKPTKKRGKKAKKDPETTALRQTFYTVLRDAGVTMEKAAVSVGYSKNSLSYLGRSVELKRRAGLLSPLAPLAKRNARKILRGERIGDADPPKTSDIVAVIREVMLRADPVTQHVEQRSLSARMEITPEDLARYRRVLGLPEQAESDKTVQQDTNP